MRAPFLLHHLTVAAGALAACVAAIAASAAIAAPALPVDGDWVSYRDAYRAMVVFEKYGKPKSLLQHQIQVQPLQARERAALGDGVRLVLNGHDSQLNLPLDATGRTVFPLLKAAYDENAALVLSRKIGPFQLRARVSLAVRPDGIYDVPELRAACEQALEYARYLDASFRQRQCVGVRFGFQRGAATPLLVQKRGQPGDVGELRALEGPIFGDEPADAFRIVNLRFGTTSSRAQLATQDAPLAIVPLFE